MATIKDVAKSAGVSIATVSNYINRKKPVSREASRAIQAAIDELQYSQNLIARNFKTKKNLDIGIILPDFNDSYYVQIFQGIKSYFQNTDYYINLEFSRNIPEFEKNIAESFLKKQICGLLLVSCQPNNWKFYYDNFTSRNIPLVLIDRNIRSLDANFVSFNNRVLMKNMANRLLQEGYRNICLMTGPEKFSCEAECIRGFQDACGNHGITVDESVFLKTDMSKEDAFRKTINLLKYRKPDVIATTSESLATGIIEGITILGYTIQDIPVFTLSEEHWNTHTHSFASDSTARTAIKLGQTASRLLTEQLNSPLTKETEKIILNGCHVNRLSPPKKRYTEESPSHSPDPAADSALQKLRLLMLDTPQVDALMGIVKNFENRTGIRVEATILPHHCLYETILKCYYDNENDPYDVFMYDIPWLPSLASEHILEDITENLEFLNPDIFLPNCLKYFSNFSGRYYGLPFMYAPQILYYRKDLFENPALKADYENLNNISLRPPVTLRELNTVADFFTGKTDAIKYGMSIPTAYSECLTPEIYMRLRAYGGNIFDSCGNVCLDSAQTLKAYINFARSIKCAKPDYRAATDLSAVQDFLAGETAMLISYPSFLTDVNDLRKNSITGSIGYSIIPGHAPLLGGWSFGINSNSRQKEAAMEFLKWTCDEQIANYSTLLGGQSAITSAYTNDELVDLYPWLPVYHSMYQYTKPTIPPTLPNGKVVPQYEIDEIVCRWIYRLLEDSLEIQDTITNTHRDLKELVNIYLEG